MKAMRDRKVVVSLCYMFVDDIYGELKHGSQIDVLDIASPDEIIQHTKKVCDDVCKKHKASEFVFTSINIFEWIES